jgi:hypothetical protein
VRSAYSIAPPDARKRRPQGGGYNQAKRLPYKHSSGNLFAYEYTT